MQLGKRAAVGLYRRLPFGIETRQKVKAALLTPFVRTSRPFTRDWRGMRVWIDRSQSADLRLHWTGDYEPETMAAIAQLARPGTAAIDVGASIGLVSLWLAKCLGAEGRVISIEPSAWSCDRMARNLALSGVTNVEVINGAVAEASGEGEMVVTNGYRVDNVDTATRERVMFINIDRIVEERGIESLSLIKIDTDGYEIGVLHGAERTLSRLKPDLIFEYGPDFLRQTGGSPEDLIALLRGHGYEFFGEDIVPVDPGAITVPPFETINLVARHPG
jgi:FkbM family methyltransferase